MAEQQKTTLYQRLTKLFGTGGQPVIDKKPSISAKELLTATSAEELMLKKLAAQQSQYLGNQFEKITSNLYQQSVYYETTRLASYADFTAMEHTPEIAATLDLVSEESCLAGNSTIRLLDGTNPTIKKLYKENKKNFWIYSYDTNNNKFIPSKAEKVIYKGIQDIYLIKLDDDTKIKCTGNHKWLGKDNKWIETHDLYKGYFFINHKVISIKYMGKEKVYDVVNSGKFNNFGVKCNSGMIISHNCTLSEFGKMLQVFSDSKRVKTILEHLFYKTLDININLPAWTRNTCLYGDNFIYLKSEIGKGIVGVKQLPNIEIRREESSITDQKNMIRFIWQGKSMEFTAWQIAHFRLLGDDRKLPYGNSFLEKVRKIWKMLILAEDAMLVYRITRAPERRVFKIDVGNLDDKDVEPYIQRVAQKFKRQPQAENTGNFTGQVDMRYRTLPVWKNTPIPLLDGRTITIEELSKEYEEGKYNEVYSIKDNTHEIVPGKVIWCGRNYKANKLIKIWLDNKTWIMSAPEHPFILRDGSHSRADKLCSGDKLMPFRHVKIKIKYTEEIYEPDDVYCMTVVGPNGENNRHNFAVCSLNKDENYTRKGVFVKNSTDEDFFLPTRQGGGDTEIDTLPGASNLCLSLDTKIPLLDGRTLKLKEIIEEYKNNKDLWVYSCNPNTGEIIPGIISWAGITRKNAHVLKITLDNGKEIISTPDHKFLTRDGLKKEAKDLEINESLMPFHRKKEKISKNSSDYEMIWDNSKQKWIFIHRMVGSYMKDKNLHNELIHNNKFINENKNIIHHNNMNRFCNNPSNLYFMSRNDHIDLHCDFNNNLLEWNKNPINLKQKGKLISKTKSDPERKKIYSKNAKKLWENKEYKNKVFSKPQKIIFTDKLYSIFFDTFKLYGRSDLTLEKLNSNKIFMHEFILSNSNIRSSMTNLSEFTHNHVDKMVKEKGYKNYREWVKKTSDNLGYKNVNSWRYYIAKENKTGKYTTHRFLEQDYYNHKITKIEWLEEKIDTGTITVDGEHKYHNFHTFAVESGVFIYNSEIADIEYIQRKLFTAMRVPKAFLGFEEAIGEGKNLALQDIRFARTINRIQQSMIQELNKIAIIHLYMLGFEEELDNFTLTLNSPSTQAEMLKIEQWKEKVLLYKDLVSLNDTGFAATSMTWAKKNILGFSDDEIILDLKQQRVEKAAGKENEAPEQIIHTGLFDALDKRYQQKPGEEAPEGGEGGAPGELPGVGGMGGGEELQPPGGGPGGGGMPELPELTEENKINILESEDKEQDSKYKILNDDSKVLNEDLKTMFESLDETLSENKEIIIKKIEDDEKE